MSKPWTRDLFADDELDEAGFTFEAFTIALQCWAYMQNGRRTSVAEAAQVFNVAPALITEAVEKCHWMDLTGVAEGSIVSDPAKVFIEHEGE